MKKFIGLFTIIVAFSSATSYSAPSYVDLVYEDSLSTLPKDSSWIKKLFSDQHSKVFLVVSLSKENGDGTDNVLLIPPKVLESFERSNGELKRTKSENLNLLMSQFLNDSEQLLLKVEFFSVKKTEANAFAESLKSLASAYKSAGGTPEASNVVSSAMDAIGSVLSENKEIYLRYVGGIEPSNSTISLYFDDSGNINDSGFASGDTSNKVVFKVNSSPDFSVDFQYSFKNQGVNQSEKLVFQQLSEANGPIDKRDACSALRKTLRKRFSESTTSDLIAIAVNNINWPQDETQYNCIDAAEAVKYKRKHGLKYLANCTSDECTKTKTTLFLLEGNAASEVVATIAGADVYNMDCKKNVTFTRLYRWSNINSTYESQEFKSFKAKSCLTTSSGSDPYSHTFSWLNGKLATHSCDRSNEDNYCN